jgi:hypothetical protein
MEYGKLLSMVKFMKLREFVVERSAKGEYRVKIPLDRIDNPRTNNAAIHSLYPEEKEIEIVKIARMFSGKIEPYKGPVRALIVS